MANLTITPANVLPTDTTEFEVVTAGEAITAGSPVYQDASDGDTYKAAAGVQASSVAVGIAMASAADGQKVVIAVGGSIISGATMTVGEKYAVSATSGAIAPVSDLLPESGKYITRLGVATDATTMKLDIFAGETEL